MAVVVLIFLLIWAVIYAGYASAPLWFVLVWSATLALSNVMTGWRDQERSVLSSLLRGTLLAAVAVVPLYLMGMGVRWLAN